LAATNAKDDVRAHALAMRLEGKSYNQIGRELGVSKSILSLWLRDVHAQRLRDLRARQARDTEVDGTLAAGVEGHNRTSVR
jgi:transposase